MSTNAAGKILVVENHLWKYWKKLKNIGYDKSYMHNITRYTYIWAVARYLYNAMFCCIRCVIINTATYNIPYKMKHWRGVNFGDWRLLNEITNI